MLYSRTISPNICSRKPEDLDWSMIYCFWGIAKKSIIIYVKLTELFKGELNDSK